MIEVEIVSTTRHTRSFTRDQLIYFLVHDAPYDTWAELREQYERLTDEELIRHVTLMQDHTKTLADYMEAFPPRSETKTMSAQVLPDEQSA